jgi:catechol 2,3-dioxygenase-like lactoylglutathione lyase family enzyme
MVSRRQILRAAAGVTAVNAAARPAVAQNGAQNGAASVKGFDHVALPMQNTDAMLAFYRKLGLTVVESAQACAVYVGDQMINFHRPATWQRDSFTLRAPAAKPPCGDLCFVWEGTPAALKTWLDAAGAKIEEGPVARQGGRRKAASSVYTRDPDGNLLEFMIY